MIYHFSNKKKLSILNNINRNYIWKEKKNW